MSRKWVWKWDENGPRMATVNNPNHKMRREGERTRTWTTATATNSECRLGITVVGIICRHRQRSWPVTSLPSFRFQNEISCLWLVVAAFLPKFFFFQIKLFPTSVQRSILSLFSSTGSDPLTLFRTSVDKSLPSDKGVREKKTSGGD